MEQSNEIDKLAAALAKAQAVMGGAIKDSANPFFKSKYADLESVWTACRKNLTDNGLSVVQTMTSNELGVCVVTTLLHSSGQWMRGTLPVMAKDQTPQGIGSAITYARRYALAAIAGVYQTDDDAEAAHGRTAGERLGPRSEASFKVDTRKVNDYAKRIGDAIAADKDGAVRDLWAEAAEDHDFAQALWATLAKPIKDKIKQLKEAA